jgi:hypothetical protein
MFKAYHVMIRKNLSFITGLLFVIQVSAQTLDLSPSQIDSLLCKKWAVDYALMGNAKIGRGPGAPQMVFEFFKNKALTSDGMKGTWEYDKKAKVIRLFFNGKSNSSIVSLTADELIMVMNPPQNKSPDLSDMKMVFKPKV